MRIVMMGTGPFAAPTFRALLGTVHEVAALVTQPVRAARGKAPAPSPMRLIAQEHGLPVFDPEDINAPQSQAVLNDYQADIFVVADYGQILASETLTLAPHGGINLHGSLLPKYRGAAPINWAIHRGDPETGVTVIQMSPRVDAGGTIAQASTPIDPDETAVELEHRLAELGAPLVCKVLDRLAVEEVEILPQDPALATKARRLRKTDGEIDWSRAALEIKNQIRALEPWPKTYTFWARTDGSTVRLILGRTAIEPHERDSTPPGTVLEAHGDRLLVAAGRDALLLLEVQPAGKRMLSAGEFLRGYPLRKGDILGPESNPA